MKALITATVYGFVGSFEKNNIHLLQELGYDVTVAVNTMIMNRGQLDNENIKLVDIPYSRSPFSAGNDAAYKKLLALMEKEQFDLIHCHTPVAGVLARKAAAKVAAEGGKKAKVIYSAHGFHFYKGAPAFNWLSFYNIEKKWAKYTDVIITINHEDYLRAHEKLHPRMSVRYVPGVGVDTKGIAEAVRKSDSVEIRKKLGVPSDAFLVISTGEMNKNKNHELVIRAVAKLVKEEPEKSARLHYVIIGDGPLKEELKKLAESLHVADRVHLVGYLEKPYMYSSAADLFVLPSKREGLCVSLVEAMAAGTPALTGDIRGNRDLMQGVRLDVKNRFIPLFDPANVDELSEKIAFLMEHDDIRKELGNLNAERAADFDREKSMARMREIYTSVTESTVQ